ncbi:hypothetical protein MRY87_03755 [bacterium]|nr:hypothetical protein [bacterium]
MSIPQKSEEITFHADRVRESTLRVVKSVALDPRITSEEKLELLTQISGIHVEMAEHIHRSIEIGCTQAISAIVDGNSALSDRP